MQGIPVLLLSLFLLLAPLAATAADSLTDLEAVGRHADLAAAAERRLKSQDRPDTSVMAPLCIAYSRLKDYRRLFPCLDQLEQLVAAGDTTIVADRRDVSDSDASPMASMLRAEALIELGDYGAAVKQAKAALDQVRDRKPFGAWPAKQYRLSILGTLGLAHALAGDQEAARAVIQQLRDFPMGFLGWAAMPSYRDTGIGRILVALGDCRQGLPYLRDDNLIAKLAYRLNDVGWGYAGEDSHATYLVLPKLLLRGKCLLETGDRGRAKADLDAALRNARIADFGELYWMVLHLRGRVAELEGRPEEAQQFYIRAIDEIERQRSTINTEANKIGFVGDKQAPYGHLVALLATLGRAGEAFAYVERSKSRALVDLLATRKDLGARGADPAAVREILARLDAAEAAARIQNVARTPGEGAETRGLRSAREEIQRVAPELASLVTVSALAADQVRSLLGENETLVEYYLHGADLYAFVATRARIQVLRLDGRELPARVRRLHRELQLMYTDAWQETAQELYARLWRPLEAMVGGAEVLVVAHGPLHYLPFAALRDGEGGFLVDRHSFRFLPAASVLGFLRSGPPAGGPSLLALGNPDLGDPKLDLPFAETEAREVASLFPDSRLLLRQMASKANFSKLAAAYPRIHLATHGAFQADEPLKSGLHLAREGEGDGLLSVGELYSMSLDADLVTLSACNTGLGSISNGDDVVGLTRGFLYAGSRSIVASLWAVEDRATAQLMKAFYDRLKSVPKREALRQAQIQVRGNFPHPYYWAAFQLTGRGD